MITVADYVIDFFNKIKTQNVFTVSGGGSIFLCDSLQRSKKINYISCHHEQAVSFAAESYARQKENIGIAVVTTGPGGTNTVTGVSSCWIDSIPVMFVSGQVFLDQTIKKTGLRQLGVQEIDIISLVKPVTKYAVMINSPNDIRFHLEKAYFLALNKRPGPVWIDIPANIQSALINPAKLKPFKINLKLHRSQNFKNNIDKKIKVLAEKLRNSQRPLLHLGQGVRISKSISLYKKFINKNKIPFSLTWNATDILETDNPLYAGRPGAFAERGANFIVQNCDILISVGSRLPFMVTGYNAKDFARNAYKVTVDIDRNEVRKKTLNFDLRLESDAKYFIEKLNFYLKKRKSNNYWVEYCKYIRKKYPIVLDKYKKQKKYVNSYFFVDYLSKLLKSNSTVVTDMGLSFVGTHQTIIVKKNQRVFTNSGHAPMGWGLPASIGVYFANKNNNIICLTGDGGLQMNIQELATIMHHRIPVKIFIYNNGGYLTIKQTQELGFNKRIMGSNKKTGLSFPNYRSISEAHNIDYVKIENHKQLFKNLNTILKTKKPIICELIMDNAQEQMPKAINKRGKDGKSQATIFEDMYPFLNKKQIAESTFNHYISSLKKGKKI